MTGHPSVTAVTPIAEGADLHLLRAALGSAVDSLGDFFQWRYACAADDAERIRELAEDLQLDHAGVIIDSPNVAATRNLLAAMGTGDYLLALDADDTFAPGGLAQMRWILDTRPDVVAAHGRAVPADAPHRHRPPGWFLTFPDETAAPGMLARRRAKIAAATAAWEGDTATLAGYPINHCAGLFRRTAVLAAGGWDEELGNYAEDAALIAKLQARHRWHISPATIVLLANVTSSALSDRALTLEDGEFELINEIITSHELGRPQDAPAPPWSVPFVDRSPRPVLGPDGEEITIPALPAGGDRPAMSLVDKFVTPLNPRDEAAKTEAEYAAIQAGVAGVDHQDLDDQTPDLEDPISLADLVEKITPPAKKRPRS